MGAAFAAGLFCLGQDGVGEITWIGGIFFFFPVYFTSPFPRAFESVLLSLYEEENKSAC